MCREAKKRRGGLPATCLHALNAYIGNYYQVVVGYIKKGANEPAPSCIQLPALDARGQGPENEEMAEEAEGAISCTPECRNDKAEPIIC